MQLFPDYTLLLSPEHVERDFGVKFSGPGLYRSDTDTMIALARPPETGTTRETVWSAEQPKGTLYEVHVWNCPFEDTVFSVTASAPTRSDTRSSKLKG